MEYKFQAETAKLLDIVANSLYTEKEMFIRELISNSSDALEKLRHLQLAQSDTLDGNDSSGIFISVDPSQNIFVIQDTGIGMTKAELVKYLGTIADSGTKEFVRQLGETSELVKQKKDMLIGQFGVGFYSSFMVSDEIRVYSKPYMSQVGHEWVTTQPGMYQITEADNVEMGTKIVLKLKASCKKFSEKDYIIDVIKRYSGFINFPIYVNGEKITFVRALWNMSSNDIQEDEYKSFYQYISGSAAQPFYRLHHKSDAPLQFKSLIFVPEHHSENFGSALMRPGVHLYSKRVLVESNSNRLFPNWLRFLKGVVDSEDLSLNLSRELPQDATVLRRLKDILTSRVLRWLADESKKDRERFNQFYREYKLFLKEGYMTDIDHRDQILSLLQFESSKFPSSSLVSLVEYVNRMKPDQKNIYYLSASSRAFALDSPYFESFKDSQDEVLFCYDMIDQALLQSANSFQEKSFVNIETITSQSDQTEDLKTKDHRSLVKWFKESLQPIVGEVRVSSRLVSSPAVVIGNELQSMQRLLAKVNPTTVIPPVPYTMEINPNHELIQQLDLVRSRHPDIAKRVAEQILDNALLSAGLFEDPRSMLKRMNDLLLSVLKQKA